MEQRVIWKLTDGTIFIGRRIEQYGLRMIFKDKTFGAFDEFVNYVKCHQQEVARADAELKQELGFIEYIFSSQDQVGQSHFPTAFKELVAGMEKIDKVGHAV